MNTKLASEFMDWQQRRNKLSHGRLKNELLTILMPIRCEEDARSLETPEEWQARLARWRQCLEQGKALVCGSAAALSPARYLEQDVWMHLCADERRRLGRQLEDDWWRARGVGEKVDAATAALDEACRLIRSLGEELDARHGFSVHGAGLLRQLCEQIKAVHRALKELDFPFVWPSPKAI